MWPEFICIEGNIGIGKTTLVKKLAAHLGALAVFEEFEENPWLPIFYENPYATALSLELSFLTDRTRQLKRLARDHSGKKWISDYTLDKCLLFAAANLPTEDYTWYKQLHARVSQTVPQPSLVIVIHSSVENLKKNIHERGREFEQNIEPAYLETLNKAYKAYFSEERAYSILNIFSAQLDAAAYENIFREILAFIKHKPISKNTSIQL
jgi:deoxyadenosine/deoxycytidine kinase